MTDATDLDWIEGAAVIRDATGLHARPAIRLTKLAKSYRSRVEIRAEAGSEWISAKSPNAVMKLRAGHAATLAIRASGPDAGAAVAALVALVDANFSVADGG